MSLSRAAAAVESWHNLKLFIEHATRIEHGTLHVIAGILVWLLVALISRRSIRSWMPWTALFAVILWNETVDLLIEHWPERAMQYGEGVRDLLLTMFIPTLLMFAARSLPQLFRRDE
jgi:hypothetical protein